MAWERPLAPCWRLAMCLFLRRLCVAAVLTSLVLAPVGAEPPQAKQQPTAAGRTDRFGDPLPPGASARLGTMRLRHEAYSLAAVFSPDGQTLVTSGMSSLRFWEPSSGRLLREIGVKYSPGLPVFSSDGKRLAVQGEKSVLVFDPTTGELLHRL